MDASFDWRYYSLVGEHLGHPVEPRWFAEVELRYMNGVDPKYTAHEIWVMDNEVKENEVREAALRKKLD